MSLEDTYWVVHAGDARYVFEKEPVVNNDGSLSCEDFDSKRATTFAGCGGWSHMSAIYSGDPVYSVLHNLAMSLRQKTDEDFDDTQLHSLYEQMPSSVIPESVRPKLSF